LASQAFIKPAIKYANPSSGEGGHPAPPVREMLNLPYLIAGVIIPPQAFIV
jgi:hypothetical protein